MNRIINTLLISALSMLLFSCAKEEAFEKPMMNEDITIEISSGLTKAGYMEDNQTESFVNHIDVFFFEDNAGSPDVMKHHGRYEINNSPRLTIDKPRSYFSENVAYHIYLVANSNIAEATFAAVANYDEFVGMKQDDRNLHLTGLTAEGAPKYFLMDAKAKETVGGQVKVILNGADVAENLELTATLRRAAAKVVINITAEDEITFATFNESVDGKPVSDGGLYYIRNLPYQAFLLAEARADETIDATVVGVRTTGKSKDGHFYWNPAENPKKASLVTYVYPNSWSSDIINRETCVVMNMPMIYTPAGGEQVVYHNSWYKIHMTGEKVFRRNGYYEVNIVVKRPGAITETVPEEIKDVHFDVKEWTEHIVDVGGDDKPSYLQLNTDHVDMYNVNRDNTSLEFASSSPIKSIVLEEAYYINYLSQKVSVSEDIKATANPGELSGNIEIFSSFVKDKEVAMDSHNNAIRYMTFTVTNEDGKSQTFTVNQYPTLYITHEKGKYSYRSDFGGTNYEDGVGTVNRSGASWRMSGGWDYSSTASMSVFFGSKVALGREGSYTINYAYFRSNTSTNASTSVFGGLNNPRMYHIHVTATSADYTVAKPRLDTNGFTESTAENTKLVSPSFMAASQLGATQRLTGGVDQAKSHCEQYIEVTEDGVVYDDWRLPTAAELDIIIKHQETSAAMATILTEGAYYCAYNTDSNGNVIYTKSTGKSSSTTPVRCVRDAY